MTTNVLRRRGPRAAAIALAASSLFLAAACGDDEPASSGSGDEAITELGELEGQVSILAWPAYVEDGSTDPAVDWVTPFETDTGCEVTSKVYGTSDEALNLA